MTGRNGGKQHIPKEYDEVLYVYDRVCPKGTKSNQMRRTYGPVNSTTHNANPNRVYGAAFAESQRRRAEAYKKASAYQKKQYGASNVKHSSVNNSGTYTYRPRQAVGGEAVRERPFKLFVQGIINLFETVEERGKADERLAKQKAIARKKFSEYRHSIITTAFILVLISVLFITFVYKTFFVIKTVGINGSEIYSAENISEASGIDLGDTLYSFKSSDVANEIIFRCTYIKSVDIDRTIPNRVDITVEDDTAVFVAKIWDDYVLLSSGLRVLEIVDQKGDFENLIEIILPPIDYSVGGKIIEFSNQRDERYIRNVISNTLKSSLAKSEMIDKIDVSNEYSITLQVANKYLMKIGDESDCDLKLRMAYKTITSKDFDSDMPASIDLTKVGEAAVRYDMKISFD